MCPRIRLLELDEMIGELNLMEGWEADLEEELEREGILNVEEEDEEEEEEIGRGRGEPSYVEESWEDVFGEKKEEEKEEIKGEEKIEEGIEEKKEEEEEEDDDDDADEEEIELGIEVTEALW
ncbi:unnamed protein product [Meloidogyne enterolobii]|uniref:Uncharacterized protein n=2 Tax=Meloidogyne enterolobii TaxID=390850 RepID=A0A6V7X1E2_MELEN|nr:unnamed protein product [Meloidogyne enterolobii]